MNEACIYFINMVRFSCFHTHIHHHKSKKEVHPSAGSMHRTCQDCSNDRALKVSGVPSSLNPLLSKAHYDNPSNTSVEQVTSSSSVEHCWKSEEMHSGSSPEGSIEVHQRACLKKSQSLGSGLDREGRISSGIDTEDEIDQGFPCDHFHEKKSIKMFDALDHNGMGKPDNGNDPGMNFLRQYSEALAESFRGNDSPTHKETIFTIGDPKKLEGEGYEDFASRVLGEHSGDSGHHMPGMPPMIAKSFSLPNMVVSPTSGEGSPRRVYVGSQCRSSEDLLALDARTKELINHEVGPHAVADQERDNYVNDNRKDKCENLVGDGYDSYNFNCLVKDWTIPGMDEVDVMENDERELSVQRWDELPSNEFKIKRIEEWVSMIDLEDGSPLQEMGESSHSTGKVKKGSNVLGSLTAAKLDARIAHGMEAAKNYISSLTATSTSAQLTNLGLVMIPFLSAFVNLRVLNLSGNGIVRITSGALPRGLHMLNLAKNNLSNIEGFRELTRLRVLDLSYNRILRIGHGLASCSSLKELYLAGNKISEVEGLHRLLKLNILDLRFNKISTAKCLGQLAANYSSLQAINLEGNPAQRNVGDEQLKKYLQGLLPHLVYFNKQPIRAGSSKEVADRPARSAITAHQFDRGVRSDHKLTRKGTPSLATTKASSSSSHAHTVLRSSHRQSKDRHGRLPPSGTKGAHHRHHYLDLGSKLPSLPMDLSMRRSQSEGNLGAS